jgi:hypothetical protein
MRIRPFRQGWRVRFRVMSAEKPISPGTVALDPRADESQENLPRTETIRPASPPPPPAPPAPAPDETEVELIVPDPVEPVVIVDTTPRATETGDEAPAEPEAPADPDDAAADPKPKPDGTP